LFFLFIALFIGCDKEKEPSEEEQDIVIYTNLLPDIKSVHLKMNDSILVDQDGGFLSFTLLDKDLNIIQQSSTNFWLAVNVYHPFPNIDVIMQGGDYASAPHMPVGANISNNGCRSFQNSFTFNPASYDYWTTYIPVSENEYYLAGGSNWEGSIIVNIKNNVQSSIFSKVLEGYNILQGFSHNDVIHVIANKVCLTQPSDNNDIYYFRSTDKGLTWTGKFNFGIIGYKDLEFQKLSDGTIMLSKSNMQNTFLSDNNGNSWKTIIHSMIFSDVSFLNKSVGIAIFDLNTLYKTTNSGSTWNLWCTLKHPVKYLNFKEESKGVVYNENLIGYTNNGGKSWKYIINGQPE
jgi:hypothetical protein